MTAAERPSATSLARPEAPPLTAFRRYLVLLSVILATTLYGTTLLIVSTIHNLAYRGIFPKGVMTDVGIPWSVFKPELVEFYDPTDVFGDLADALAEAYPAVAPDVGVTPDGDLDAETDAETDDEDDEDDAEDAAESDDTEPTDDAKGSEGRPTA